MEKKKVYALIAREYDEVNTVEPNIGIVGIYDTRVSLDEAFKKTKENLRKKFLDYARETKIREDRIEEKSFPGSWSISHVDGCEAVSVWKVQKNLNQTEEFILSSI